MRHYKIRPSITNKNSPAGNIYLRELNKYPLISEVEERKLIKLKEKGDENAKTKLIEANLKFVVAIAKQYQGKGVPFMDLISVGNMGLIEAANRFKSSFGYRFISYAVWWIREYILKELTENGTVIRIPAGKNLLINKLTKISNQFEQENGRPATYEELAEILDSSPEETKELMNYRYSMVNDIIVNAEGKEESIYDTLVLEDKTTDEDIEKLHRKEDIINILKEELTDRECQILYMLFGFNGVEKDYAQVAEELGLTKDRIRQIKDKAIIKLRKCSQINKLQNYL